MKEEKASATQDGGKAKLCQTKKIHKEKTANLTLPTGGNRKLTSSLTLVIKKETL